MIYINIFLLNIHTRIEGFTRKPALVQDTKYMVKTYHIAQYLGGFWVHLMPQ